MSDQKVVLTATVAGKAYTLENPAQSIIDGLLLRGFQKVLTDAHSTATRGTGDDKRKATDAERVEDVEARLAKLVDGSYQFGGGGGKATTPEAKALRAALTAYGIKGGKGKTVDDMLTELAEQVAADNGKDYEPEMADTIRAQLEASEVYTATLAAEKAKQGTAPATGGLSL